MPIPTFTQGYPPDGSSLGQTKKPIRDNLDGTFQTLGVDHVNNNGQPGSNPAGYHTIIHQVTQSGPPTPITGVNQVFSMIPPSGIPSNTDTQLFTVTGDQTPGEYSQLTGNNANATNGSVWCAGILIQWGQTTSSSSSTKAVSFTQAFPNNCFNAIAIPIRAASSPGSDFACCIVTGSVSKTGFTIGNIGAHSVDGFYWAAIGN